MDDISSNQDSSFDVLISHSCKILSSGSLETVISPEGYNDIIRKIMDSFDNSCFEHCCSVVTSASEKSKRNCSQRSLLLSSLCTVFKLSSNDDIFYSTTGRMKLTPSNSKYRRDCGVNASNEIEDKVMETVQNCKCVVKIQDRNADASNWYERTSYLLLGNDKILETMLQLFQSKCLFTSFLAKKSIISCITCKPSKIGIILQNIEASFSLDFRKIIKAFDILREFMSHRYTSSLLAQIYDWFTDNFDSKFMMIHSRLIKESMCRKDEWMNLFSFIAFIKKLIKYGNNQSKEIKPSLVSIAMDILISQAVENSLDDSEFLHQPLILKTISVLNMVLNLDIVLKKGTSAKTILETAVYLLKLFPSTFSCLRKKSFSFNKLFWGNKTFDSVNAANQYSYFNYSIAKQFLILSLKSCVFSCYSGLVEDEDIKCSAYQIYDVFRTWFIQEECVMTIESEWLPAFLGEDDDQWITVLLCFLLIHTNVNKKQENQVMPQALECHNENLGREHEHYNTAMRSQGTKYIFLQPKLEENLTSTSTSSLYNPICPHRLFIQFVQYIAFDHLVIADFLLSPETIFLAYFTKYIYLLNDEWEYFSENYNAIILKDSVVRNRFNLQKNDSNCDGVQAVHASTPSGGNHQTPTKDGVPKNLPNVQTCETVPKTDDSIVEPPDKKIKFNSTISPSSTTLHLSDLKTGACFDPSKNNKRIVPCLVSYTDSEESNNEYSDSEDDLYDGKLVDRDEFSQRSVSKNLASPKINVDDSISNALTNSFVYLSDQTTFHECSDLIHGRQVMSESSSDCSEQESCSNADVTECCDTYTLERFMTMLIRLQLHIERLDENQLIPYNTNFLLKVLNMCIEKYECA